MLLSKIDWELLDGLSYRTQLNKSLKNTLRKFDVDVLFNEINTVIQHYIEKDKQIVYTHRIKAIQSCSLTEGDQLFNEWMHTYFYKYVDNYSVGLFLRRLYEQHIINTEEDFRKEMSKYVLFDCKKI